MAGNRIATFAGALLGAFSLALPGVALAQADDEGYISHTMRPGETLSGIQAEYLTSENAVRRIALLNRIYNPRRIPVGTVIRLPRDLLRYQDAGLVVRRATGNVFINGDPAANVNEVPEGALITTGPQGYLVLSHARNGSFAIPSNTRARLARSRLYTYENYLDVRFEILGGRSEVTAPALRPDERWRTTTPVAVTAVRGTEYRIAYNESTGLGATEVTEGTVAVAAPESADSVPATEGFGIVASADGLAEPEALLPEPEFTGPRGVQTGEQVSFAHTLPEGAVAVRTQLATDATFLEVVRDEVSDGEVPFSDLPDGRYYVRARAISESGLEGFSQNGEPSFLRRRVSAAGGSAPVADGFRFTWSGEGAGVTHYALQIWRENDPENLLYDELAMPGSATVITDLGEGNYVFRVGAIQTDAREGLIKIWGPEQPLNNSGE